ncbi:MAG: SMC-Scp complex subunit ScpB, partial [Cellvibrionales bacterium]|nr:SMC-Scp complex subunit ScpB [Cellvibrionales bacterium]
KNDAGDQQPLRAVDAKDQADTSEAIVDDGTSGDEVLDDESISAQADQSTGVVDEHLLPKIVEAIMLTANKPMTIQQLQKVLDEDAPDKQTLLGVLESLSAACHDRGVELVEVASGWRYQAKASVTPWVSQLFEEKPQRYSRATLETLALIAYRQPITRGEIEEVRGVAVSSQIIRSLQEREWVKVVGYRDVPGRPAMYATTREFLDDLGLKSLENLPALADIRELGELNEDLELDLPPELLASMTPQSDQAQNDQAQNDQAAASQPPENPDQPEDKEASTDKDPSELGDAQEEQTTNESLDLTSQVSDDSEGIPHDPSLGASEVIEGLIPTVAIESPTESTPIVQDFICVFDDHLDAADKVIDALDAIEKDAVEIDGEGFSSDINLDGAQETETGPMEPPADFDSGEMPPAAFDDE